MLHTLRNYAITIEARLHFALDGLIGLIALTRSKSAALQRSQVS
jgi:hypothetical protein